MINQFTLSKSKDPDSASLNMWSELLVRSDKKIYFFNDLDRNKGQI